MFLIRLAKNAWKWYRVRDRRPLRGLPSPGRFGVILQRERKRTDRNGDPFSVVTFAAREADGAAETFAMLASLLRRRLRSTDEIGWLDRKHLAVMLPSTTSAGAQKVADDVCLGFSPDGLPPFCEIWCYPFDEIPRDGSRPRAHRRPAESPKRTTGRAAPVHSMEPLLTTPLPLGKRTVDIVGASLGLLVLSPLMLLVAASIKLTSRGPVLYTHERTGQGLRRFKMYKFRTMIRHADGETAKLQHLNRWNKNGPLIKIDNDPRVTFIGRILRRTSIDELPQLINVLKGDLSLIGPRAQSPLPAQYELWQRRRYAVRSGVACTWQAERRDDIDFTAWMRSDLRYVDGASPWGDARLLVKTVVRVCCHGAR